MGRLLEGKVKEEEVDLICNSALRIVLIKGFQKLRNPDQIQASARRLYSTRESVRPNGGVLSSGKVRSRVEANSSSFSCPREGYSCRGRVFRHGRQKGEAWRSTNKESPQQRYYKTFKDNAASYSPLTLVLRFVLSEFVVSDPKTRPSHLRWKDHPKESIFCISWPALESPTKSPIVKLLEKCYLQRKELNNTSPEW